MCSAQFVPAGAAERPNGFDLSGALVDRELIRRGGPPRDGIPSIDEPSFTGVAGADRWLADEARVLGIEVEGVTRAYPVPILDWHEIVNDRIGDRPLLVTWCPLCGSGVAYDPRLPQAPEGLEFGVSGLLYNSDVLLYDRATESLWSQLRHEAVAGPLRGTRLETVLLEHTSWKRWKSLHPDTRVLARPRTPDGRFLRDYSIDPYDGYRLDRRLMFPVGSRDRRFHPKEVVLGITLGDAAMAWPLTELARSSLPVRTRVGAREVLVHYDRDSETAWVTRTDGERLVAQRAFWFAWYAFHPETDVWTARAE
jgi:hypothetical protein